VLLKDVERSLKKISECYNFETPINSLNFSKNESDSTEGKLNLGVTRRGLRTDAFLV
jgi:hypothetical protein